MFEDTYFLDSQEALRVASQKNRPNMSVLQACYYAGEKIETILTEASGNHAPIGGLKIITQNGWVAMRPSGTEEIYKIYAESFLSEEHLTQIQQEAQNFMKTLFESAQ